MVGKRTPNENRVKTKIWTALGDFFPPVIRKWNRKQYFNAATTKKSEQSAEYLERNVSLLPWCGSLFAWGK